MSEYINIVYFLFYWLCCFYFVLFYCPLSFCGNENFPPVRLIKGYLILHESLDSPSWKSHSFFLSFFASARTLKTIWTLQAETQRRLSLKLTIPLSPSPSRKASYCSGNNWKSSKRAGHVISWEYNRWIPLHSSNSFPVSTGFL